MKSPAHTTCRLFLSLSIVSIIAVLPSGCPRPEPAAKKQVKFPFSVEIVPGKLKVRVYLHDVPVDGGKAVSCWSYVSEGLWQYRQKEIVFTLRRELDEEAADLPDAPFEYFRQVHGFAEKGQLVDAGGFTLFGAGQFLGHKGVGYIDADSFRDFDIPKPALAAILLKEEELEALKAFGMTRVMSSLGKAYSHYPCPPWSDRRRASIIGEEMMERSLLTRMRCLHVSGAARLEREELSLRLFRERSAGLPKMVAEMGTNTPVAFLTEFDVDANGCLVWAPGQKKSRAITPPGGDGSRLTGSFIMFVSKQSEDRARLLEDGFGVLLTPESWARVRDAIVRGTAMSIPLKVDEQCAFKRLSVEWVRQSFFNPVDGRTYYTRGEMKKYGYQGPPKRDPTKALQMVGITLLTDERTMSERVETKPFASYTWDIREVVSKHCGSLPEGHGQDLIVQVEIDPDGKTKVEMVYRPPPVNKEVLNAIHKSVSALPAPEVKGGPVKFHILFALWGGFQEGEPPRSAVNGEDK